jgi:hypothetical protein
MCERSLDDDHDITEMLVYEVREI